jgi:hypothetical protein
MRRTPYWQALALIAVCSCLPRWLLVPEDHLQHIVNNYLSLCVFAFALLGAWISSTDEA